MDTERERTGIESAQQETADRHTAENREDFIRREYDFAPDVKLKECRFCRVMIPKKAKVCPNCRMNLKRHWFRNLAAVIFAVVVIGVGGYYLSGHWGIMKDAVTAVWRAQDSSAVPVVSVTTMDTTRMAAGAAAAETSAVTSLTETDPEKAAEGAGAPIEPAKITESAAAPAELTKPTEDVETSAGPAKSAEGAGAPTGFAEDTGVAADPAKSAEDIAEQADPENEPETLTAEATKAEDRAKKDAAEEENDTTDRTNAEDSTEQTDSIGTKSNTEQTDDADTETAVSRKPMEDEKEAATADGQKPDSHAEIIAGVTKDMDRQEQAFREECIQIGYKSLLRDTEGYLDAALMVELQVVRQVDGGLFDDNVYYLCKTEDGNDIIRYYIVRDDRETDDTLILEGDILTVFGRLFGTCKIPADLIGTRPVVPAVSMLYYDLTGE